MIQDRKTKHETAVDNAKRLIKKGDKVGICKCPGTKRVFIFDHWDGCWMVSKSGIDDNHPSGVYSINGIKVDLTIKDEEL